MTHLLKKISPLPIAFGGAAISGEGGGYGFGNVSEDSAIVLLKHAYEKGVTVFDTAPIYGFGTSEIRMGKAFKNVREKVFIVSKSGVTWHDNKRVDMTNDPIVTKKMLEQSLRDLNTDYIDLYMIHWPDKNVDIRRPLEVLNKAKHEGKIKHIGLCNTTPLDLKLASEVDRIEVVQSEFNFFQNQNIQEEIFPILKEQNISFMSWGTLDKGILTGRVDEKRRFEDTDCRSWAPWWKGADHTHKYEFVKKIRPLLESRGHSLLGFALAFNLSFQDLSVILCGAKSIEQFDSLINALRNLPSSSILTDIVELAKVHQK